MGAGMERQRISPLWLLIAGLLAALVAVASVTPLRGQVVGDPTVFRPDRFVAVTVPDDLAHRSGTGQAASNPTSRGPGLRGLL